MMLSIIWLLTTVQPAGLDRAADAMRRNDFHQAERISRLVWLATDSRQGSAALHFQAANALGAALSMLGRQDEAERMFREAALADASMFTGQQADVMRAMSNLAQMLAARGETDRAEPMLKRSLWWFEHNSPDDSRQLALEHHNLGSLYLQLWKHSEAREHLEKSAQLWIRAGAKIHGVDALQTDIALGLLAAQTSRFREADQRLQRVSVEIAGLRLPATHPLIHSLLLTRAIAELRQGRPANARELLEQTLRTQWQATEQLPNGLLMRSIDLYRRILERSKDRESLRRVSRWAASLEHGHLKPAYKNCSE